MIGYNIKIKGGFNMIVEIYKDFMFEVVYFLFNVLEGYKCGRLYGYFYKVRIYLID